MGRCRGRKRALSFEGPLGVVACLLVLGLPGTALAAFPGDNGKIAFQSNRDGNWEIYVVNPDGSGQTRLTNNPAFDGEPAWSPDGQKIAFTSKRDGTQQIYVMNGDGSGQTRVTNIPGAEAWEPAWSPDGQRIAFTCCDPGWFSVIAAVNVASGQWTSLTSVGGSTGDGSYDSEPAWSPDGQQISFTRIDVPYEIAQVPAIYTADANGSNVTQRADYDTVESNWSPDSLKIAFYENAGDYRPFASGATMNRDGSGHQTGPFGTYPAWSPDGQRIVSSGVYITNLGTGEVTPVNSGHGSDSNPDWQSVRPPGYARPKSAAQPRIKLAPAYRSCTSPNANHGPPLASVSCSPPIPASDYLTVGTPDANGASASSTGSFNFDVFCSPPAPNPYPPCTDPGDQADVSLTATLTDVRNRANLTDYTGELWASVPMRITDRANGAGGVHPGTASDTVLGFSLTCLATASDAIGSTCSAQTTADALLPGIALEGKRAVWGLGQVQVYDGGADSDADTTGDNTLFMEQGLFVP